MYQEWPEQIRLESDKSSGEAAGELIEASTVAHSTVRKRKK
jgi:hypothetical protein